MSLVALKRKTNATYKTSSSGSNGFSINGTRRNQGYIGQTSLSRHLIKTPYGGNVPKGHGGCCGTYIQTNIKPSELLCLNNSSVVKGSSVNTKGMIREKYKYVWRPQPYSSFNPRGNANNNNNLQSNYIDYVAKNAIASSVLKTDGGLCDTLPTSTSACSAPVAECNITKSECEYKSLSQSEYLKKLSQICLANETFFQPENTCKTPFP